MKGTLEPPITHPTSMPLHLGELLPNMKELAFTKTMFWGIFGGIGRGTPVHPIWGVFVFAY